VAALVAALDHLEDAEGLSTNLAVLGARHAEYGMTAAMYGWVAEALLATLAKVGGDEWTATHETAWTRRARRDPEPDARRLPVRGRRAAVGPAQRTAPSARRASTSAAE